MSDSMKTGVVYRVREGPIEYAIWNDAIWIGRACMPNFHHMETLEVMPRKLIVHIHAIQQPKPDGKHD